MSGSDRVYLSQPDPPTILVFVSQWKYLNSDFGWQGRDEIMSLVLATPGVDVSALVRTEEPRHWTSLLRQESTCSSLTALDGPCITTLWSTPKAPTHARSRASHGIISLRAIERRREIQGFDQLD
jgi:hypothetical protein